MLYHVYLFVGLFALITTIGAASTSLDELTRIVSATLGSILWAYWALSSYQVTHIGSGVTTVQSYQGLAFIGAGCAMVMLVVVFKLVFGQLGNDDHAPENPLSGQERLGP